MENNKLMKAARLLMPRCTVKPQELLHTVLYCAAIITQYNNYTYIMYDYHHTSDACTAEPQDGLSHTYTCTDGKHIVRP